MSDLAKFLAARLDEDEAYARYSGQWVEACQAMRAILGLHAPDRNPADEWYGDDVRCTECGGITGSAFSGERGYNKSWPCPTLRALAAIWSDHPDYRQEWKPALTVS